MREQNIQPGDRIAGFMPNCIETVVAMLATTSLGAVWSSCSPDFGHQGAVDRFGQIAPRLLFTADGYVYNGKRCDSLARASDIARAIPEIERVVVVPVKAAAGYAHGYGDPEWVSQLPTFGLPLKELAPDRTYRMFQIEGDSMLPIPSGSYILCQYVDDWMSVGGLRPHIVVTKSDGVVFKRIENDLPGGSRLVLHSDNPAFAPYAVAGDDVVEVWRAAAYLSFELPSALDGQPASAASLRSALDTLRGEIDALKRAEQS